MQLIGPSIRQEAIVFFVLFWIEAMAGLAFVWSQEQDIRTMKSVYTMKMNKKKNNTNSLAGILYLQSCYLYETTNRFWSLQILIKCFANQSMSFNWAHSRDRVRVLLIFPLFQLISFFCPLMSLWRCTLLLRGCYCYCLVVVYSNSVLVRHIQRRIRQQYRRKQCIIQYCSCGIKEVVFCCSLALHSRSLFSRNSYVHWRYCKATKRAKKFSCLI